MNGTTTETKGISERINRILKLAIEQQQAQLNCAAQILIGLMGKALNVSIHIQEWKQRRQTHTQQSITQTQKWIVHSHAHLSTSTHNTVDSYFM